MRELHIEPVVMTARLFKEGESYKSGGEYEAVLTIQRMRHVAYLTACHGDINIWAYKELTSRLKEMGITEIHWLRGDEETDKDLQ